jgi:anti-anti-sigma factor
MYDSVLSELKVGHPRPGTAVVEVVGEHDLSGVDETAQLFGQLVAENPLVIVDLSETQFIDSSFLRNLKNAQKSANEVGHTLLLQVNTEPIVKRVLEITNFLDHFDHVSSREEALAWSDNQLETQSRGQGLWPA